MSPSELETRTDIDPGRLSELLGIARDHVKRRLMRELPTYHGRTVDQILDDVVYAMQREEHLLLGRYEASLDVTRRRALAGELTETVVVSWIRRRQTEDVLAALATLAGFPIDLVVKAYQSPGYEPLLILVRAVGFEWQTLKLLLEVKAGRLLPSDLMASLFEQFTRLSGDTAQRALRFVASRACAVRLSAR